MQNNVHEAVEQFIRTNFVFDETRVIGPDESLTGSGIMDSTGVLELIAFLEQTYGVKFGDEDLVADNFDTLKRIAGFMARKMPAAGS